jgi:hypothetical protein
MKRFVTLLAVVALLALFSGSASASHGRDRCYPPPGCHRDRCYPPPSCYPRDRYDPPRCYPKDPCHTYPYRPHYPRR